MAVLSAFHEGGIFMYFILIFGLFTMALMAERSVQLFIKVKAAPADFRARVLDFLNRGDLKGAENYANSAAHGTAIGTIASLGCKIRANAGGAEELQARMDETLSHEISKIDRRTAFLAMFGNVATLLGLLGTISGMIHSFAAVASASPADRATMLSKGISEAMNCTAFGLIVAIPALVAFAIFQNRTDQMVTKLTETTTEIYHDLMFVAESASANTRANRDKSGSTYQGVPIAPGNSSSVSV